MPATSARAAEIGLVDKCVKVGVPGQGWVGTGLWGERLTLNTFHLIKMLRVEGKMVLAFLKSVFLDMRLLEFCLGEWI